MINSTAGELLRKASILEIMEGRFGDFLDLRRRFLTDFNGGQSIHDFLGEKLTSMFTEAHGGVGEIKSNKNVAIAGSLWQSLCMSYLNTSFAGTQAAAVMNRLVPESVKRMFAIKSHGKIVTQRNTTFVIEHPCLGSVISGSSPFWSQAHTVWLDREIRENPELTNVTLLDFRTNFSDAIKEPLLYDWLLHFLHQGLLPSNILPGEQFEEIINILPRISSFAVSVLTGTKKEVAFGSAPAVRAGCLSGGIYWGKPAKGGVAQSLNKFASERLSSFSQSTSSTDQTGLPVTEMEDLLKLWL